MNPLFPALILLTAASVAAASEPQPDADVGVVTPTEDGTAEMAGRSGDPGESAEASEVADAGQTPAAEPFQGDEPDSTSVLNILDHEIGPGETARLNWAATELFEGVPVSTPVLVINGAEPGPTLCLTAAVHGDELNGIEMVRRVMHDIEPERLSGALIGVPIVNVQGFRRGSRYLPDRRDLNRHFPGNPTGSAAARIAHSFFTNVVAHCDALVDLHTGSFERANLPQIRADLGDPDVLSLTLGFGSTVILHSKPGSGTLRLAATRAGIPTVTLEAGGPLQLELSEVKDGVKAIDSLMVSLGMVRKIRFWGDPEPIYYRSSWVRADSGGILLSDVSLGSSVREGDLLGTITDPMSNARMELRSPYSGRIIGMARNQVVMPGFAAFHVGIQTDQAIVEPAAPGAPGDDSEGAYTDGISE